MKKVVLAALSCFISTIAFTSTTVFANDGDPVPAPYCTGPNCHYID